MRSATTLASVAPAASTTTFKLLKACRACRSRSAPPIKRRSASQAVCPDTYSVLRPLATTPWEKPWSRLRKSAGGLMRSLVTVFRLSSGARTSETRPSFQSAPSRPFGGQTRRIRPDVTSASWMPRPQRLKCPLKRGNPMLSAGPWKQRQALTTRQIALSTAAQPHAGGSRQPPFLSRLQRLARQRWSYAARGSARENERAHWDDSGKSAARAQSPLHATPCVHIL